MPRRPNCLPAVVDGQGHVQQRAGRPPRRCPRPGAAPRPAAAPGRAPRAAGLPSGLGGDVAGQQRSRAPPEQSRTAHRAAAAADRRRPAARGRARPRSPGRQPAQGCDVQPAHLAEGRPGRVLGVGAVDGQRRLHGRALAAPGPRPRGPRPGPAKPPGCRPSSALATAAVGGGVADAHLARGEDRGAARLQPSAATCAPASSARTAFLPASWPAPARCPPCRCGCSTGPRRPARRGKSRMPTSTAVTRRSARAAPCGRPCSPPRRAPAQPPP